MYVAGWILFGLIVGVLAGFLLPGRDPGRFVVTTLLGIAGALIGGFLGRMIGWGGDASSIESIAGIFSGCVIPLAIYGMWKGRSASR
jgi:uncharacterized membrane protein YeaQ/YmgE (transglycosylase-associated protein family)